MSPAHAAPRRRTRQPALDLALFALLGAVTCTGAAIGTVASGNTASTAQAAASTVLTPAPGATSLGLRRPVTPAVPKPRLRRITPAQAPSSTGIGPDEQSPRIVVPGGVGPGMRRPDRRQGARSAVPKPR